MDDLGTEAIKEFQKLFDSCSSSWTSFVLRTMFVKAKDNSWRIYYREAVLQRKKTSRIPALSLVFESENVKVFESRYRIDAFEPFWQLVVGESYHVEDDWQEGSIQIKDMQAEYKAIPRLIDQTAMKPKITKGYMPESSFGPSPIVEDLNWPAVGVDLQVKKKQDYININKDAIAEELRAHPSTPFMSLEAVANCYMDTFPVATRSIRNDTIICIFAPVYFRYEKIALSQGGISFSVRVDKSLAKNTSVAVMPTSIKRKTREGAHLNREDFKISSQKDVDLVLKLSQKFNERVSYVSILSFIENLTIPVSIHILYSEFIPNLRAKVHQYWDPQNQELIKFCKGEDKNTHIQDDFEYAVSTLLHIAGYQIEHIGQLKGFFTHRKKHAEIDIFAFPPNRNRIYAVECTVGPIDEKAVKVKNVVVRMGTQIKKCHITPVIATSLTESEIPKDALKEAGKKGIIILYRNLLIEILEKTQGKVRFVDFLGNIARRNYLEYMAQ